MGRRDDSPEWRDLPGPVLRALDLWLEQKRLRMNHRGWFTAGRSQDRVGLVERIGDDGQARHVVAKFFQDDAGPKVERFERAHTAAPEPFRRHLATLDGSGEELTTWWMILQYVARGDLSTVSSLTDIVLHRAEVDAGECCRAIVRSLIAEWNQDWNSRPEPTTSGLFLQRILDKRIRSSGPIHQWAQNAGIPFSGKPDTVSRPGWDGPLPNPFALVNDLDGSRLTVDSLLLGHAHGDLSGRNIVVPATPAVRPDDYVLIDLDRVDEAAPLTRDPMHLLLAIGMDILAQPGLDPAVRRDLRQAVLDPDTPVSTPLGERFRSVSDAIQGGAAEWAMHESRAYGHNWREQSALSLVAVALMHVGRSWFPAADKDWCFQLAALAAQRFLEIRTRPGAHAPVRRVVRAGAAASEPATTAADEPMDTLRLCVCYAPADGAAAWKELSTRLAGLRVHARALKAEQARDEIAQADALAVLLTTGLVATEWYRQAVGLAKARSLPILTLRVHPVGTLDAAPSYDIAGTHPQWEPVLAELRRIGSAAHLIERYESRLPWLEQRYAEVDGWAKQRFGREADRLRRGIDAQRARRAGTPHAAYAPGRHRATPPHAGAGPRCHGEPPPVPPGTPLDRELETADLLTNLQTGRPVTLIGRAGVGKTAMVARLLHLARTAPDTTPIDGFVYLPARGPYPINAITVLSAVAAVAPDRLRAGHAAAAVQDHRLTWSQKVDEVLGALDGTRVLLVLDDVQDLLTEHRQFIDRQLHEVLDAAVHRPDAGLMLLMVSTRAPIEPGAVRSQELPRGLMEADAWRLLCAMDPDGLLSLEDFAGHAPEVAALTDGHPRILELIAAVLHGDPELTLTQVVEELRATGKTGVELSSCLLTRILAGLDRTQLRVLQAMAVIGRPVEPSTLDAVLDPYLPGQLHEPTLAELARRRLLRFDGQHYLLPRDSDHAYLLDRLDEGSADDRTRRPPPLTRRTLCHLAAEHFAGLAPSVVTALDADRRIAEIEMRVSGVDRTGALRTMEVVEHAYLRPRGAGSALLHLRERIDLGDDYLAIHNLASRAAARLQQDDVTVAVEELYDALELCRRLKYRRSACRVRIQLGNAFLRAGYCVVAAEQFGKAFTEARLKRYTTEAGQALAGLMRCRSEHARFGPADKLYEQAVRLLAEQDDPAARRTRTALLLTKGTVEGHRGEVLKARSTLNRGEREARLLNETVLVGGFLGARAILCMDAGLPETAARLAGEAVHLGAQTNNLPLCREAATTLAQAHLCMGLDSEHLHAARAAADHAVRLSQSPRAVGAFAAQGIAAFRGEDYPAATSAFTAASERAEHLCRLDRWNFEMHDLLGVVNCGLGLLHRRERFDGAVAAFKQARTITSAQTIVLRVQRLLTQLVAEPDARTERVLSAAAGSYPDSYP